MLQKETRRLSASITQLKANTQQNAVSPFFPSVFFLLSQTLSS
jgi:hypothetical protein